MVTLSDGSLVRLNNASKIVYPESFPDSIRQVQLIGEAYFDVAAESRPFVVFTKNARIRVLGTEFNVWTRNEETRVIVKEGRVSFRSLESDETGLVLVENQMAVCKEDLQPVETQPANPIGLLGWLEGRIVFDETRLKEVADELSRIYDVEIGLQNPELDSLSISGSFQKKPLEEILEAICLTLDLEYRFEGGGGMWWVNKR
jgi:transmembrane sensor